MQFLNLTIVALFGLIIGSFLTVCVFRIPYGRPKGLDALNDEDGESDVVPKGGESPPQELESLSLLFPPRSFCPSCKKQLAWYHNIPLFSWLFLRGRCGFCSARISPIYPIIELLSAIAATMSVVSYGFTPTAYVIYAFCAALIVISFIDIDYFIIPDVISIPGTVIALGIGILNDWIPLFAPPISTGALDSLIGILAGAGFLWVVAKAYITLRNQDGLGLGDVKLLALVGSLLGPQGSLYTIFIGSLLGSLFGGILVLFRGRSHRIPIQFGPFLAIGAVLYAFFGYAPLLSIREEIIQTFLFFAERGHL